MAGKYAPGDTAYIAESGRFIREVKVVKVAGGLVTLRFADAPGGVRLHERRLFPTPEAARAGGKRLPSAPYPIG